VAINMLDMIGVGPFITLPLLLGAMGGSQAMLGWVCGAVLALCDGLVWAELGAAMPEAGGTYRFLRAIYPGQAGRFLAFLFVFQLMFSAPLSVASGCIGLGQYATYLAPSLGSHTLRGAWWVVGPATAVAIAAVVLALILLSRNLTGLRVVSCVLWCTVIATIGWILVTALVYGHLAMAFDMPPGAFHLNRGFFSGLASAMLIATYDFWGYYNITFLGAEVRDPARTIPRAILISIGFVALLYLALNVAVLAVVPWRPLIGLKDLGARQALISFFIQTAYAPQFGAAAGAILGKLAAALVMVTAFASVFSLLLGYSRIPFAAARDDNFFRAFGRLHRAGGFPKVSLLYLGGAAILFCFLSLGQVIAALVVLRIVVQFLLQHVGVMVLRYRQPELRRPFRVWLYPLPPVAALLGFGYILVGRPNYQRELAFAAAVALLGCAAYGHGARGVGAGGRAGGWLGGVRAFGRCDRRAKSVLG
jgi:APA family basic amino acid/polyamine antiporter